MWTLKWLLLFIPSMWTHPPLNSPHSCGGGIRPQQQITQREWKKGKREERRHMARDGERKMWIWGKGGGLVCGRGKEEEHQCVCVCVCVRVHNKQDELKAERRGIQKHSRRGKRERFVCETKGGEQAWDGEEGLEGEREHWRQREREREGEGEGETAYSDFTTLQSPIPLTLYSPLQSPQWEPDMHYHCVPTA